MKFLLKDRPVSIRIISSLFFLIGIAVSFPLWMSQRAFPLAPIAGFIPKFPAVIDVLIVVVLMLSLGLGILLQRRGIFIVILVVLFILLVQDQMRWQPWVYLYLMLLLPFASKIDKSKLTPYFQILIIGVYLWSGIHKFSPEFLDNTYRMILMDMFGIESEASIYNLRSLGYIIPAVEIAVPILLIIPKTRTIGVIGAIITHLFIGGLFVMIGINTIVYPWNIAMILLVITLFHQNPEPITIWKGGSSLSLFFNVQAIILFILLPSLSLVERWDHYLSFSLYSGKTNLFYICVDNENAHRIDADLQQYYWQTETLTQGEMISMDAWAIGELNVPFYPEQRVFKKIAQSFCTNYSNNDFIVYAEFDRAFKKGAIEVFNCSDLKK
jgi:hypothetical protein